SIERRKQLNKGFNDWLIYERMRVDRANESQMMKQVRDWAQLGQHIQGALTQAMSSFVDSLADGKFAFKDFAKQLLKELLKIIIQAMIAYAIMSALGMANNSAGQPVSFGSFMKGQMSAGFGGSTGGADIGFKAAPHHTGGIIGQGSLTRMVSTAMFANAQKYHT